MKGSVVGGEGKEAEIDGGYFGGYVKPANLANPLCQEPEWQAEGLVLWSGNAAEIRSRQYWILKAKPRLSYEAASWDNLHARFEIKRINHQEAYSLDGACTNMAEEYFSRLRRAEIGIHHHIGGAYLLRYAQESSWREDNRRVAMGDQVNRIAALASVDFTGGSVT
jgi:ISXO2-like transposase domain